MERDTPSGDPSKECDSLEVFDLILSDNFQKENDAELENIGLSSSLIDFPSHSSKIQTTSRSALPSTTSPKQSSNKEEENLFDIIERDNFHSDESFPTKHNISNTVLSNLPSNVVHNLVQSFDGKTSNNGDYSSSQKSKENESDTQKPVDQQKIHGIVNTETFSSPVDENWTTSESVRTDSNQYESNVKQIAETDSKESNVKHDDGFQPTSESAHILKLNHSKQTENKQECNEQVKVSGELLKSTNIEKLNKENNQSSFVDDDKSLKSRNEVLELMKGDKNAVSCVFETKNDKKLETSLSHEIVDEKANIEHCKDNDLAELRNGENNSLLDAIVKSIETNETHRNVNQQSTSLCDKGNNDAKIEHDGLLKYKNGQNDQLLDAIVKSIDSNKRESNSSIKTDENRDKNINETIVNANINKKNEVNAEENDKNVESKAEEDELNKEELTLLMNYVEETKQRLKTKSDVRKQNLSPVRNESKLSKLDSSLKKNSAFVKKLKNFTSQQLESLLKDLSLLNLTKYMSEITSALVEVKLKLTDVPYVLELCSELHKMYSDFSVLFFEQWTKSLTLKKDESKNASKLRVDLRFYGDLISHGIFQNKEAFSLLGNVLTVLMTTDKEEHNNLNIIISFCKHCGEDYAGLVPKSIETLASKHSVDIPSSDLISLDKQKNVKQLLVDYFQSLCKHIWKENGELKNFEKQNERILQSKGELRQERKEQFENSMSTLKKLTQSAETFAELIGEKLPEIPKDKCVTEDTTSLGNIVSICGTESEDGGNVNFNSIWDDEEMQSFYQDIPFLKDFFPHLKVKVTSPIDGEEEPWRSKSGTPTTEEISEDIIEKEIDKLAQEDENKEPPTAPSEEADTSDVTQEEMVVASSTQPPIVPDVGFNFNAIRPGSGGGIDTYLSNLYKCENREMIDNAATEFIMYHNTKANRKKLSNTLLFVPRTRIDLLPFLSRFVAILHPFQPDIGNDLTCMLKNDFKYHTKKKDQINIESKIKNVRYIGELVKFKLYSKIEVLYCLKVLLNDFAHHHVEMCCHLLETCGRYLYRSKDTHPRIKVYLEQMIRKRQVLNLDARYNTMIENAFYYVNPPEARVSKKRHKPEMQMFVEKVLYVDLMNVLDKDAEPKVLNYLLKLNWNEELVHRYTVRALTQAWNVKYDWIKKLANILAGLVEYHENVGVEVVDNVLEDIRICLEINHPKLNQRRLSVIKYLGELYNYRLVESNDVFKVLYSLLSFGVIYSESMDPASDSYNYLDPPDNLFRIKLICVLLETCGQYFSHGITRTKLDFFFVYFQHYFWYKMSHPMWKNSNDVFSINIRNYFKEILIFLRPNIKLCKSFDEAKKMCKDLQTKLWNKMKPLNEITNNINVIKEEEEDDGQGDDEKDGGNETGKRRNKENDSKTKKVATSKDVRKDKSGLEAGRSGTKMSDEIVSDSRSNKDLNDSKRSESSPTTTKKSELSADSGSNEKTGNNGDTLGQAEDIVYNNDINRSKDVDEIETSTESKVNKHVDRKIEELQLNSISNAIDECKNSDVSETFEEINRNDKLGPSLNSHSVSNSIGATRGMMDGDVNSDELTEHFSNLDVKTKLCVDEPAGEVDVNNEDKVAVQMDLDEDVDEDEDYDDMEDEFDVLEDEFLDNEGEEEEEEVNNLEPDIEEEEEEDEFASEFDKMMFDNIQERIKSSCNVLSNNKFQIPVNFRTKRSTLAAENCDSDSESINFTLMVRNKSNNKQTYKRLVVPKTCDLVRHLKSQEKAAKAEMDYVKKLTLNISDRFEQDQYQDEMMSSSGGGRASWNASRYSNSGGGGGGGCGHYQHQKSQSSHKGPYTPDADVIFGKSKKPAKFS